MRTTKLAHEHADEGLETKRTISTSPSLHIRTLILTSHPHPHARAQVSSCASFGIPNMLLHEEKNLKFLMLNNKNISVTLSKKNEKDYPVTGRD
jgi:hypothetical protein